MKEADAGPSREIIALKQSNAHLKKLVAEEALVIDRLRELNEVITRGKTHHEGVQGNDSLWRYQRLFCRIHASHVRIHIPVCGALPLRAPQDR